MVKVDKVIIDAARISEVKRAYYKWKSLNDSLKGYCSRGINFPETISEPMACYVLSQLREPVYWNKGSGGDAISESGEKIEIKASSNFDSDVTSFGPKCTFDQLIFLRLDIEEDHLYVYDLNLTSETIKTIPANKTQTIGEQQQAKRRPRISVIKKIINEKGLEPLCIFDILNTTIKD